MLIVLEPLQSRLITLFSQPRHHGGDAVQVIKLLRKSEVEKVGLIGGDQVQHSLRFQDLGLELGDRVRHGGGTTNSNSSSSFPSSDFFLSERTLKIVSCISVCFCYFVYFFVCLLRWSDREMPESKRERSSTTSGGERERKWGRKEETCGPNNGNKLGPTRIESRFESSLDSKTGQRVNSNLTWNPRKIWVGISLLT